MHRGGIVSVIAGMCVFAIVPALACEKEKACGDIYYCASGNSTPANRWRESLVRALHDDDINGIIADTNACQTALGANRGKDWSGHIDGCDVQDIGRHARSSTCTAWAVPPAPPPQRGPGGPTGGTCVTSSGQSCPTTIGRGGSCLCEGEQGTVR